MLPSTTVCFLGLYHCNIYNLVQGLSLSACCYIIVIFTGWFRACQELLCVAIVSLWLYYCYIYMLVQGLSGTIVCCLCGYIIVIVTGWFRACQFCCVLSLTVCGYIIVIFTGWSRPCHLLLCAGIVSLWLYNCYIYRMVQDLANAAVCCHCQPVVI